MRRYSAFALASACVAAAPVSAAPLYSNNFDGAVQVAPGVVVVPLTNVGTETATVGAWNANGWAGNYAANRSQGNPAAASVISFSNLPAHTQISVSFLLGFLESWDGSAGDFFRVIADGTPLVFDLTSNNAGSAAEVYGGGTELFDGAQINTNFFFSDTLVNMATASGLTFAHTASTLTLSFQAYGPNWQGAADEGWGIDSLALTFDPAGPVIPEPANWALMMAGFGLAGAALRRRRLPARA
jgi:hypothetical protein